MRDPDRFSEDELVRRFRGGDEEAFALLVGECRPVLQIRAGRHLTPAMLRRVSVADLLQEAQLVAFRRREDFEDRGPGAFRRWMLGIVDRVAQRAHKVHAADKRALGREVTRSARLSTANYGRDETTPSRAAERREDSDRALQALDRLSSDHQEVLRLTLFQHLTAREAAVRMGRTPEAVKKLTQRAMAKFAEAFEHLGAGENG